MMNSYERWKAGKLGKKVQAEVDRFAGATGGGFEERAYRAGWMAYQMLEATFERYGGKDGKRKAVEN